MAHAFAQRPEAQADRRRRRYLMEGSFAHAANCYHFKRSRWRRLWRQQIQDGIIAAVQNIAMLCGAQAAKVPVAPPKPPRSRSVRSDPLLVAPYCRSKMAPARQLRKNTRFRMNASPPNQFPVTMKLFSI